MHEKVILLHLQKTISNINTMMLKIIAKLKAFVIVQVNTEVLQVSYVIHLK